MKVIINCDDFGMSEGINEAVYQAHRAGRLSSATLLVESDAVDDAVAIANDCPELGVGLHLNLDRFLGYGVNGYYGSTISNVDSKKYRQALENLDAIKDSIEEQFTMFFATKLPMSHVDGHHHVHLLPGIFQCVLETCVKYKVHGMRFYRSFYKQETAIYEQHCRLLQKHEIQHSLDFRNFVQPEALMNLQAPITEVMVHVATSGAEHDQWRIEQQRRLTSEQTGEILKTQNTEILSYHGLNSISAE